MAHINRDLREALLNRTQKRKFRVQMLNESQQRLREGLENKLHIKQHAKTIMKESQKCCPHGNCNKKCAAEVMHELFPFVRIMRRYNFRKNLLQDVVAGMTVGIMHIPQGMAYGFLSQLPPIYGLYTSFFPVLLYFFFGSSRHVSVGTFAVVSLMVGQVVNKGYHTHVGEHLTLNSTVDPPGNDTMAQIHHVAHNDGYAHPIKLGFALSVTFVVGVMQLLLGMFRMGFLAGFMSDPFISGFTTGAAVHVFSSQIKHVFGVRVHPYYGPLALVYFYSEFFLNIRHTNMVTFTASLTCILVLVLIKEGINNNKSCKPHLIMPIPIELIVITISTITSHYTKLNKEFNVQVVGDIPSGLPTPELTNLKYIPEVLGDGLTIGFIAYAISYSMAKILADRHGYRVNANQEMVALGVCNFVSSFFQSYCCAASLSRSLVQDTAGGKTQEMLAYGICNMIGSLLSSTVCVGSPKDSLVQASVGGKTQVVGLVSSFVVLVVLLYIGPLFETLPECILASIVIVTLKGMFMQFRELKRLWRLSKRDFAVWVVTFTAVVVLDVALGLLIGIVFSLYFVLRHSQKPQMSQLGNVPGTGAYKDLTTTKKVQELEGIKIFRFETSIYFANAEHFRDQLYKKTKLTPRKLLKKKRKAMHFTLLRRQEEIKQAEEERQRQREASGLTRYAIEIVTGKQPVDPHLENLKKMAENKIILERFSKAWQPPIKILIIDLSVVNYVDTVAVRTLWKIVEEYKDVGIKVFLAGCKPDVRTMLKKADFNSKMDHNCLFYTVHEAVVIGREIVDAEKSKTANPTDVKLMEEMTVKTDEDGKPLPKDDDDEENDDFDDDSDASDADADDENEDNDPRVTVKPCVDGSDEEEQWFESMDTSPCDEGLVLISAQEAASSLQANTEAVIHNRKGAEKMALTWKEMCKLRPVQSDDKFDSIPLHGNL